MAKPSGFQVFYMKNGEAHTFLRDPVSRSVAEEQAKAFEDRYYNRAEKNGVRYGVSRPWVGRV